MDIPAQPIVALISGGLDSMVAAALAREGGYRLLALSIDLAGRMPTRAEKAALHLPAGVPVIDLLHVSVRADGQPYEATRFVMRADMSSLTYDVPVE